MVDVPSDWLIQTLRYLGPLYDAGGDYEPVPLRDTLRGESDTALETWRADPRTAALFDHDEGYQVQLSDDAITVLDEARRRKNDKGLRRRDVRNRLLAWVDQRGALAGVATVDTAAYAGSAYAWSDGEYFSPAEITEAVEYLLAQDLLVRAGGAQPPVLGVTEDGQQCAGIHGSDVAAFVAARQRRDLTVTTTPPEQRPVIDAGAADRLAAALRQALPVLGLGDGVERYLLDLDLPDDDARARALRWFGRIYQDPSTGALGSVLAAAARDLLQQSVPAAPPWE